MSTPKWDLNVTYTAEDIHRLINAFELLAKSSPQSPRFYARGHHLFLLVFQLDKRLRFGATYVEAHPENLAAAALFHDLMEARDLLMGKLGLYWREDFRVTTAKLLFDAEEVPHGPENESEGRGDGGPDPGGQDAGLPGTPGDEPQ